MKIFAAVMLGIFAIARDCGDDDNAATPATTGTGLVSDQVYGTWACTAAGRDAITFTVAKTGDGVEQQWQSDGATGVASVHLDALYLEAFENNAYDDYTYVENPKGTLAALDEYTQSTGTTPYHCVRQ